MRLNFSTLFLASISVLSAALLASELRTFSTSQTFFAQPGAISVHARLQPAISIRATHQTLSMWDRSMSSPMANYQSSAQLLATAANCADFASRVAGWMPTHGFAYLVAAQAAQIDGEHDNRARLLEKSRLFAPFEGWLAERRVGLIANQITPVPDVHPSPLSIDIATLLTTQSGAELLATIYLRRPRFRTLLAHVTAQASPQNQTRFMHQIQQRQAVN